MHGGKAPQVMAKAAERRIIAEVMQDMAMAAKDPERIMAEVGCIAYSRPGDLYGEDGAMIRPEKLPPHVAASVASVEQETVTGNVDKGDGKFDKVLKQKVRLWDKPKMLELLAKHLGLLEQTVNVNVLIGLDERIRTARKRLDGNVG